MLVEGRALLESHLGRLLGFDDGAAEILEHLISIESREDLLEYLLQLLGDATKEVTEFVDNVGRFRVGEPLVMLGTVGKVLDGKALVEDSKPPAKEPGTQPDGSNKREQKSSDLMVRRNQRQQKAPSAPPRQKDPQSRHQDQPKKPYPNAEQASPDARIVEKTTHAAVKTPPPKGKADFVCGCFGTKHKALTNCLFCGRISCLAEGYGFCGFCGYLVEEIRDVNHGGDEAWIRKERLLRFDREFARRTEIFDDQADFQGPETWMTEEEIAHAEDSKNRLREALKRPKQTLRLGI